MKKLYNEPKYDVEIFKLNNVITTSDGLNDGFNDNDSDDGFDF